MQNKPPNRETLALLFLPYKQNTQKQSTFCDTLPAIASIASNTAAAEARGEVPAVGVHRALVSVVGTRLVGIRVVAENCSEKTQHTCQCFTGLWTRALLPCAPSGLAGSHICPGNSETGLTTCSSLKRIVAPLLNPPKANGSKQSWRNHKGELF